LYSVYIIALKYPVEEILLRYHKMKSFQTIWMALAGHTILQAAQPTHLFLSRTGNAISLD
jgi:hypothetical protein